MGKDFPENRWQQGRTEGGAENCRKLDENGRIDQSVTGKDYAWTYILNDKKNRNLHRILPIQGSVMWK